MIFLFYLSLGIQNISDFLFVQETEETLTWLVRLPTYFLLKAFRNKLSASAAELNIKICELSLLETGGKKVNVVFSKSEFGKHHFLRTLLVQT